MTLAGTRLTHELSALAWTSSHEVTSQSGAEGTQNCFHRQQQDTGEGGYRGRAEEGGPVAEGRHLWVGGNAWPAGIGWGARELWEGEHPESGAGTRQREV